MRPFFNLSDYKTEQMSLFLQIVNFELSLLYIQIDGERANKFFSSVIDFGKIK